MSLYDLPRRLTVVRTGRPVLTLYLSEIILTKGDRFVSWVIVDFRGTNPDTRNYLLENTDKDGVWSNDLTPAEVDQFWESRDEIQITYSLSTRADKLPHNMSVETLEQYRPVIPNHHLLESLDFDETLSVEICDGWSQSSICFQDR